MPVPDDITEQLELPTRCAPLAHAPGFSNLQVELEPDHWATLTIVHDARGGPLVHTVATGDGTHRHTCIACALRRATKKESDL